MGSQAPGDRTEYLVKAKLRVREAGGRKQPWQTYCLRATPCLAKYQFEILITVRWVGPRGSIQFHTICL